MHKDTILIKENEINKLNNLKEALVCTLEEEKK